MRTLILTLETVGDEWDALDEETRKVLSSWIMRGVYTDAEQASLTKQVVDRLRFSPYTGKVLALSLFDISLQTGVVYHTLRSMPDEYVWQGSVYKYKTEYELLENFWEGISQYERIVTFHGERIHISFLEMRSIAQRIRPSSVFSRSPFVSSGEISHLDLASVYGRGRRGRVSLRVVASGMGVIPENFPESESEREGEATDHILDPLLISIQHDTFRIKGLFDVWQSYIGPEAE